MLKRLIRPEASIASRKLYRAGFALPLGHRECVILHPLPEARSFVQTLMTADISSLSAQPRYAALLDPRGRVLFDVFAGCHEVTEEEAKDVGDPSPNSWDGKNVMYLEFDGSVRKDIIQHLALYRMRRKVTMTSPHAVRMWSLVRPGDGWGQDEPTAPPPPTQTKYRWSTAFISYDPRIPLPFTLQRAFTVTSLTSGQHWAHSFPGDETLPTRPAALYHILRIILGLPEGPGDMPPGSALPFESNLDLLGALSPNKGCYVGQELTTRTQISGVVRKRLRSVLLLPPGKVSPHWDGSPLRGVDMACEYLLPPDPKLPSVGSPITIPGVKRPVGRLGLTALNLGTALLRTEHYHPEWPVKLMCGDWRVVPLQTPLYTDGMTVTWDEMLTVLDVAQDLVRGQTK